MCTVSWLLKDNQYEIFCNRDELKTRQRAQAPEQHRIAGCLVLAPTDTDAGGSWISSNEHGFSLCLLNHYSAQQAAEEQDWISRGQLLMQLSAARSLEQAVAELTALPLHRYRSFHLLMFAPRAAVQQFTWDGQQLGHSQPTEPVSSSSYRSTEIIQGRRQHFAEHFSSTGADREARIAWHAGHAPGPEHGGAESVCMHRDDAQTVSFSHIVVAEDQVQFQYWDGPPCQTSANAPVRLARAAEEHAA